MMIFTNGTTWREDEKVVTRQFEIIATHKQWVWVKALNGAYEGELLTFPIENLRPLLESEK